MKRIKKMLALFLTVVMVLPMVLVKPTWAAEYSFSGTGTAEDPYQISTASDFTAFADAVINGTTFEGNYFAQTADIDFSDSEFNGMLGDTNEIFAGIYDGKGHVMTNVNISGKEYNALFGIVTGTVMNLGVESGTISGAIVASLVRTLKNGGKLINCYSKATVNGTTRGAGLVNYINGTGVAVRNCWFAGTATQNAVIGYQWNASSAVVTDNYYLSGSAKAGTAYGTATAMSEADMKAQTFVDTLNNNRENAAAAAGVEFSEVVNWTVCENDYPVLTQDGQDVGGDNTGDDTTEDDNSEAIEALGELLYTFQVMSDSEVIPQSGTIVGPSDAASNAHFDSALKQLVENEPDSAALFIVGDVVARGLEGNWKTFQNLTSEEVNPGLPELIYSMVGNHDVTDDGTYAELYQNFLTYSGMENTYYDTWINGYHFICLGQEDTGHNVPYFSEAQFTWLEEKLAEEASYDKPIFVFNHYPLRNTTAGSHLGSEIGHSIGSDDKLRFMELLKEYPQVILFNAHTHFQLTDKDTHYNVDQVNGKGADIFNTGALSYMCAGTYDSITGAQHQYVEVYEKGVHVRGWDVLNEAWIDGADYIIDTTTKEPTEMETPKIELDKTSVTPADGEELTAYITYEDTKQIEASDGAWVGVVSSNEEGVVGKAMRWAMIKNLDKDEQGRYIWKISDDAACEEGSTAWLNLAGGELYVGVFEDTLYLGQQPVVTNYNSYQYDPYGRMAKASFTLNRTLHLEGEGTKEAPYIIANAEDFVEFAKFVISGETFSGQYFTQIADLDFAGVEYTGMVGDSIEIFDGIYNGCGYTMSNLSLSGTSMNGVFGIVTGTVMNVGIESGTVTGQYTSGLVRTLRDGGVLVNCYSKANVTGTGRGTGLVDYITGKGAIMSNCWFAGTASGNAVTGSAYNSNAPVVNMTYYLTGSAKGSTATGSVTAMSEADMQSETFVETLNTNRIAAAAACGVDVSELVNWVMNEGGYPVMSHEGGEGEDVEEVETYGVNLALNKTATASGLEAGATEAKHGAHLVVDGNASTNVSLIKTVDDPYITIDLGKVYTFNQIVIKFQASPQNYEVQYSVDGEEYITIGGKEREALVEPVTAPVAATDTYDFAKVEARYVRYQQKKGWVWDLTTRQAKMAGNPYEIEVYHQEVNELELALEAVATTAPTLDWENGCIVLPESPDENYVVTLEGSDNQQIITNEGKLYQPLVDMTVNLVYRATSVENPEETMVASENAVIIVPGKYQTSEEDNEVPNVMPGLREWKGASGNYIFTKDTRIVITSEELRDTAVMISSFFADMIGVTPEIVTGESKDGDILLVLDAEAAELGTEGYLLEIDDQLIVTAPVVKGILYGGISIVQMLYQDDDQKDIPKGICRDYPKYEVRAGMIDVGRLFIPIDYLEQIAKYMAWFKMSELHVHINDDVSYDNAFRVESKLYPEINEGGQYYTQEEYRKFQENAMAYGIDIVTEIDAPAHASALSKSGEVDMLTSSYMDITTDEALQKTLSFVQSLCDEFLDGEDPVFKSSKFHIGTDEYSTTYSEQMRKYTDAMINYVNEKGLECRLWGSCSNLASPHGFKGSTPVSSDATMNLWDPKWTNVQEMYDDGYQIINTCSGHLYIVPGGAGHPTFHPNRLYLEERYKDFEVNIFKEFRTEQPYTMPLGLPQTKGAEFALWNDTRVGLSEYDVFDRMKDGIFLIAEKTWYGEDTEEQTVEDFLARIDAVDDKAPQSNPAAFVDSETSLLARYNFETVEDGIIKDESVNGYDGTFDGSIAEGKNGNALVFTGSETLSLPMNTVGYPYTVSFDLKLDADNPSGAKLFDGEAGSLYFAEDGTLQFERFYNYVFKFAAEIPTDTWTNIKLICDQDAVALYVNGEAVSAEYVSTGASRVVSKTFVLSVEAIGYGMKGQIDNLYLTNMDTVPTELSIITQPIDAAALKGEDAVVTVEAVGDGLTYTWYYKNPGNVKFYVSGSQFVNEDGSVYTIPMYAWRDGQEVYCVVTDQYGNTVQTNTVTLTMDNGSIQIIKQPEDVIVAATGDEAVVIVEATGTDLTYQWYYKNPGNVKFYASGAQFVSEDGASYTIPVAAWRDGQQVYCVITDANGISVQTNIVTLSVAK